MMRRELQLEVGFFDLSVRKLWNQRTTMVTSRLAAAMERKVFLPLGSRWSSDPNLGLGG